MSCLMKVIYRLIAMVVATLICSSRSSMYHDLVIQVSERKGSDNETCLTVPDSFCQSLEFIASYLQNYSRNITIMLDSQIFLRNQVTFNNSKFLTIKGRHKSSKIICTTKCKKDGHSYRGLLFFNAHYLMLSNIRITSCCGTSNIYCATLMLFACSDVTIKYVSMYKSKNGSALVLINPQGVVDINFCTFTRNGHTQRLTSNTSFAGGIHLQFSEQVQTNVTINKCRFRDNLAPRYDSASLVTPTDWNGNSIGGGMCAALLENTSGVNIQVINSIFLNNNANWGGGLCIYLQKYTHNNEILIFNSTFTGNHGNLGGGGVQVRLGEQESGLENYILFKRVTFINNTAKFGGGTSINAMFVSNVTETEGILQFTNCTWFNNYGRYSPAVDLSPCRFQQSNQGYLPIPLFKDIIVIDNHVLKPKARGHYHVVQGVFVITRFFAHFQGLITFKRNWYSALYLTSGRAIFDRNSNVIFHSNWAIKGGAVAVHGFSGIILNDNSQFQFINNSAAHVGGGIFYASSDLREYFEGRSCFLMYGGKQNNVSKRNITITFHDNNAPLGGLSIYSESLFSCYFAYYEKYTYNLTKLFDRIGDFHFDALNSASGAWPLATAARSVRVEGRPPKTAVPGERLQLPIAMYDEFYNIKLSEFALRVEDNKFVHLENYFTVNNSTRIYGAPNQTMTLVLSTPQPLYAIEYFIPVRLLPCSPGFFFDVVTESCKCSADSPSHSYPAITKCNELGAFIKSNYWAGYYPDDERHPDNLYTAFYPSPLENYANLRVLPNGSDYLSDFMCGNTREGVLCGACKMGYSALYHSREMVCRQNTMTCNFGIIIFLLSEILPAILFFTFVMMFGVNFSSGSLNGFIFYCQVVDAFSQDLVISEIQYGSISLKVLKFGYQLIYGIFNFDYFPTIPFCLWKGATVMDVIAFKYLTTTFAFLLIIFVVIVMNYSTKRCSHSIFFLKHYTGKRSSATHGISAVLIICYGQCTRASFLLLTKTYLRGKPGLDSIPVTYYGGLPYFGNEHLPYAILAIIFTIVLVCLPPFCLILYPSSFHLLELCGLSEHRYVNMVSNLLCLSHFVPLLDAFQSSYKDKLRCFAGFYFLYRVVAFLTYMYSETVPPVLIAVLILGIHSILQPYKSWQHNVIDVLIFLNITIINCLTIMIKFSLITENTKNIRTIEMIQLGFIYLPFLSLLLVLLVKCIKKVSVIKHITARSQESYQCSNLTETIPQVDDIVTHSSVKLSEPLLLELESSTVEYS